MEGEEHEIAQWISIIFSEFASKRYKINKKWECSWWEKMNQEKNYFVFFCKDGENNNKLIL